MTRPEVSASRCAICDTALTLLDRATAPVCRKLSCAWSWRTTPSHLRCAICLHPLRQHEQSQSVCSREQCRRESFRRTAAERRESFEQRARELRAAAAKKIGEQSPERFTIVSVPRLRRRVTRLPAARKQAFRAHLRALVDEAMTRKSLATAITPDLTAPIPPAPIPPDLEKMLGGACAHCRGKCCGAAGTHAYLDVHAIARYMDEHPDVSRSAIERAYVQFIGTRTFENGCIFQGRHGCTLPRDMRANICNTFFCDGLREFQKAVAEGASLQAFVVANDPKDGSDGWGTAFLDARELRVVRRGAVS